MCRRICFCKIRQTTLLLLLSSFSSFYPYLYFFVPCLPWDSPFLVINAGRPSLTHGGNASGYH